MSTGPEQLQLAINKLELSHYAWLSQARTLAKSLSKQRKRVTSDDLRRAADKAVIPQPYHCNAWGSIFRGESKSGQWIRIGSMASQIPSNHARIIGIWNWKEAK